MTQNTAACQPVIVTKTEYKGTKVVVLEDVYEPAEDTFLLAECAVSEFSKFQTVNESNEAGRESSDKLNENSNENFVLEVGCGSGFVSAFLQNNIPDLHLTAVDINPAAVLCAQMNGIHAIESDMFGIFEKQPLGFDMILFNPPYLPTSDDEKVSGMLNYAFDGGISGRDSIDRFLSEVGAYLKDGGFFLLLISSITGLDEVTAEMKKNGFFAEVIGTDKVSFEELIVLKGKRL